MEDICGAAEATTKGVKVRVAARFHPERSQVDNEWWFFSYTVQIANLGDRPVQLISRHWIITDGTGQVRHVRGEGVVGKQPRLLPGQAFQYTSSCPLATSLGAMEGTYQMRDDDGELFDAVIPVFSLSDPAYLN